MLAFYMCECVETVTSDVCIDLHTFFNKLTDSIIMKHEPLTLTEIGCFPNNCHCGQQDRQSKYNVTGRAYLQPLSQWKNNKH
jgi:hypothetical protein